MKKGIELSINFLVTIVIALTIFGFGVKFIYNLASEATELESLTTSELDKRIGDLLCESTDKICIGKDKKIIRKGDFDIFGIKLINIRDVTNFKITIKRPNPSGYTPSNNPIFGDELKWNPESRTERLEREEERELGLGISIPKTAISGTYIFDVNVSYDAGLGNFESYGGLHKLYVEVP